MSIFLPAAKQLYEWFSPSFGHTFLTMFLSFYHHEIFGNDYHWQNDVHAKGQGQRSKFKVTKVKNQFSRFWTVTPVWIHLRHKAWCGIGEMSYCFSRSSVKFRGHDFDPNWAFPDCSSSIQTLHDFPSQMNSNLLISNSKLMSNSKLI